MQNPTSKLALTNEPSVKPAEKKAWRVKRKSVPAELQAPAVRVVAHDIFAVRPNTDAIGQQFGNSRVDMVDAVMYELHRRVSRVESMLGLPAPGTALPIRCTAGMVLSIGRRAA